MKLWLAIAVAGLVVAVVVAYRLGEQNYHRYMNEVYGFRDLTSLADKMIEEGAPGVVEGPDGWRIQSFGDFYAYVAKVRPKDVAAIDAPNPFPGILDGKSYPRLLGPSTKGSDKLIWNPDVYIIRCSGAIDQLPRRSRPPGERVE